MDVAKLKGISFKHRGAFRALLSGLTYILSFFFDENKIKGFFHSLYTKFR